MEQTTRRPRGRRSRGNRRMVLIPTSDVLYVRLVEESRRQGIGISEYICAELARHHDMGVPEYIQPTLAVDVGSMPISPRKNATTRVPEEHHGRYQSEADARGMSLGEYARRIMAARLALEPEPAAPAESKEEALLSA